MGKEEQLFKKRIQELAGNCFSRDIPVNTDFLSLNEQTIFRSISGLPPVRYVMDGGYEEAERKVVCFLPSYEESLSNPPFDCLRVSPRNVRFAENLDHRDFLGAVMGLGIERSVVGDILLDETGAYVFVMSGMSRYLMENLTEVRHTNVTAEFYEGDRTFLSPKIEELSGSVSSLRLDAIVALAGRVSRSKAVAYIEGEKVFLNGAAVTEPSRGLKERDVLSIRGIGKFRFLGLRGETKKGRIMVKLGCYR